MDLWGPGTRFLRVQICPSENIFSEGISKIFPCEGISKIVFDAYLRMKCNFRDTLTEHTLTEFLFWELDRQVDFEVRIVRFCQIENHRSVAQVWPDS